MNHDLSNRSSKRTRGAGALSILLVGVVVLIAIVFALAPSLFPIGDPRSCWERQKLAASVIFTGSYFALAIGRIPGLNIDRAGIALVAGLVVASGALPLADTYKAGDLSACGLSRTPRACSPSLPI